MRFSVVNRGWRQVPDTRSEAFLVKDRWNDYGYVTMFELLVVDREGHLHQIGNVKIGRLGMGHESDLWEPPLPVAFDHLGADYFSLGQDDTYYENLKTLGDNFREDVLTSLRDVAYDSELFARVRNTDVTRTSLLRFVHETSVTGQFRRIARGGVRLSAFRFAYTGPVNDDTTASASPIELTFEVTPESLPPTNVHVLIGRNGVGKSYLLNHLTRCVADSTASREDAGKVKDLDGSTSVPFVNVVPVSFSAFDDFPPIPPQNHAVSYTYVGLKVEDVETGSSRVKTLDQLAEDFAESVEACLTGSAAKRWTRALSTLSYSSSGFLDDDSWLADFMSIDPATRREKARELFRGLSSGHKIVLLSVTMLVAHVAERSLVLIDEPESHLHPPLLAAFIRALSDLLTDRNGVAVIATHSPVVLQEVPARCVSRLRRNGAVVSVDRPTTETFGENVGVLTHEIFTLEVTDSGFHRELRTAVEEGLSYEQVLERFAQQLGGEAKAIVRTLIAVRDAEGHI